FSSFTIRHSDESGAKTALVLPDIATCPDCLNEVFDPANRRYLYPFTNCTNCGPRFSIIEALPYDRPNTSMKKFTMCPVCQQEYNNPLDRRFHAQPNACPACGPHLELWDAQGRFVLRDSNALSGATSAIREGRIVAVKGLGGFHLIVDARNEVAVVRLREKKHREEKPLALMFPTIESVETQCTVTELERRLLLSPESPIVLLERKRETSNFCAEGASPPDHLELVRRAGACGGEPRTSDFAIAPSVAPNNPYLGIMLPYTPLHHILLRDLGFPVVATSGNISDEPICTDEHEAVKRLDGIVDMFLVHDRPIVRHVDDSIVRVIMGRELVVRRARGYAPLPVSVKSSLKSSVLAVGAHLKNTVALTVGENAFISQHIGDLETHQSLEAFRKVIADFQTLYGSTPAHVVCDMHPDYLSSKEARRFSGQVVAVQHHYAHVTACMAENELDGEVLGVSWDGAGYGLDGTIWGGEFLLTRNGSFERVATFRPFRLPGGEKAIKEPRRTALGVLHEVIGEGVFSQTSLASLNAFSSSELDVIRQMLQKKLNSPLTSSVGRLFDAVASITGLRQRVSFEGQAAMELEFAMAGESSDEAYGFSICDFRLPIPNDAQNRLVTIGNRQSLVVVDWSLTIKGILEDLRHDVPRSLISVKFHNMLSDVIVTVARRIGVERVVLTGGCFQNKYLTERAVQQLRASGLRPYWHQRVPPNDGGISLGQIYALGILNSQRAPTNNPVLEEAMR
ncbi:MAG: carbamoyltransferase HypF, partial [Bacteroidota bacterium]